MSQDELNSAIRESVEALVAAECPIERVLAFATHGGSLADDMRRHAVELGWFGLAVPEAAGGSGLGVEALVSIYEALGGALAPLAFLGQQLCIAALVDSGLLDDPRLPPLVVGDAVGNAAWPSDEAGVRLTANDVLTGAATFVLDDPDAKHLLLFASDVDGTPLVLLVTVAPDGAVAVPVHDRTRRFITRDLSGVAVQSGDVLAKGEAAERLRDRLAQHAALAIAADSVGGARAALARTIAYMQTREQFGRLIGSFQALKHRVATLKVRVEAAASLLQMAAEEEVTPGRAAALAMLAKARASETYALVGAEAIQLHGGIGFTWENPIHLFLKRAKVNQTLLAGNDSQLDQAARLLVGEAM